MQVTSITMSPKHSLVSLGLPVKSLGTVKVTPPTHWIFAIDCSGSMSWELQNIRTELKNKLPKSVKELDVVSVIWFSGRGQCGTLVEGLQITSLQGLQDLQTAIDRFLKAIGLTGFKEPLETTQQVVERVTKKSGITSHSLMFLTDGHDNCWGTQEIMKAVEPLSKSLSSVVFVEYGYYCNRPLLTQMAEKAGGRLIFSEAFQDFQPVFEQHLGSQISGNPKKKITLPSEAKYGFAFSFKASEGITSYAVEDGAVLVDDEVDQIYYHAATPVGEDWKSVAETGKFAKILYASLVTLSQRMKSQDVYDTLGFLGDVALIDIFTNAFGKQNLYAFQNLALEIAENQRQPYEKGWVKDYLPAGNVFCLMNLFETLMETPGNMFVSEHPAFQYERIGAKKVMAPSAAEVEASAKLEVLMEEYAALDGTNRVRKEELLTEINATSQAVKDAIVYLKFAATPNPGGTPITEVVWNESRPNLSIRVKQYGTIELPTNKFGLTVVDSFRYRNYTLIKDGIVNVKQLPVRLAEDTFNKLVAAAPQIFGDSPMPPKYNADQVYVLELTKPPIINRDMVTDVSAETLFRTQFDLIQAKGSQSVFNYFQKEHFPRKNEESAKLYSDEAAEWLKELGVTDFNGFAPRTTDEKVGESYLSTELNVKIKGITTAPSVKDVWAKIQAGKDLTPREEVFREGLRQYKGFIESEIYLTDEKKEALLKTWLLNKQEVNVKKVRALLNTLARIKFAVILGQVWFKEFGSLEENMLTLDFNGKPYDCTVLLENKEIAI